MSNVRALVSNLVVVSQQSLTAGPFALGQIVADGYEILSCLASGGMGVVYEARDLVLQRRVAIKVARGPRYAASLRREAIALAALNGAAFPKIHHLAREGDDELIVMERIVGETLESYLDELRRENARITVREAVDILAAIASALAIVHAAGMTQRDLKPGNVILCADRIVLVDFGLVVPEVLVGDGDEANGTPDYVAPEVLRGRVCSGGGPLVDLYALGAVAYELLVGRPPFEDIRISQILKNQLRGVIPDVRTLRPEVPQDLAAVVRELLAKNPGDRPVSAEAVVWELLAIRERL
jgi:serine/threonine-protein kinase